MGERCRERKSEALATANRERESETSECGRRRLRVTPSAPRSLFFFWKPGFWSRARCFSRAKAGATAFAMGRVEVWLQARARRPRNSASFARGARAQERQGREGSPPSCERGLRLSLSHTRALSFQLTCIASRAVAPATTAAATLARRARRDMASCSSSSGEEGLGLRETARPPLLFAPAAARRIVLGSVLEHKGSSRASVVAGFCWVCGGVGVCAVWVAKS